MAERTVVGGSIAALVAADALSAAGDDVKLLLPERGIGGGFASIRRDGRELELGVRLLELSYEGVPNQTPPLRESQAAIGAHREYVPIVNRWVRELLGARVVEVERPLMYFDGRVVDDLYFTTDALALREALSDAERALIEVEARAALAATRSDAGVLDPARKDELGDLSTAEASRRNHGEIFHRRLIVPIAEKLVNGGAERVLATHRRKIWLPLFWPVTLVQACGDSDVIFKPSRPFHTVTPSGCAGLLDALLARLGERGVRRETVGKLKALSASGHGAVEMRFSSGQSARADHPILGCGAGELFAAAGVEYAPESARSVICWVEAKPADLSWTPSLLTIVDPQIPALRVSSGGQGTPGTQLLTVELRHDLPKEQIAPAALSSLVAIGLVPDESRLEVVMDAAAPTFAIPTKAARDSFADAHGTFSTLELQAEVVGGGAAFGADALGDQIIQGLRAAEVLLS